MTSKQQPDVFREGADYDVNARDDYGRTRLHHVIMGDMSLNAVHSLLVMGADVNARDRDGMTPLMDLWQCHIPCLRLALLFELRAYSVMSESCKQIIECLLYHGADPQLEALARKYSITSTGDRKLSAYEACVLQSVLAHLALIEARGTLIVEHVRNDINRDSRLRMAFNAYGRELEQMKRVKVWRSITLYELLIANEVKIVRYARNKRVLMNLRRLKCKNEYTPYYIYVMRNRIVKAVKIVNLRRKAAAILCEAVGLCQYSHSTIIDKISSYLNERDLRKLY